MHEHTLYEKECLNNGGKYLRLFTHKFYKQPDNCEEIWLENNKYFFFFQDITPNVNWFINLSLIDFKSLPDRYLEHLQNIPKKKCNRWTSFLKFHIHTKGVNASDNQNIIRMEILTHSCP